MLSLPGLRGLSLSRPKPLALYVRRLKGCKNWIHLIDMARDLWQTAIGPRNGGRSKSVAVQQITQPFFVFFFLSLSRAMCQTQAKQSIHLTSVVEIWMCAGTFSDTSLGEALWRWPQSGQRRHWTVGFWAVTIINFLYSFPSLKKWQKKFET